MDDTSRRRMFRGARLGFLLLWLGAGAACTLSGPLPPDEPRPVAQPAAATTTAATPAPTPPAEASRPAPPAPRTVLQPPPELEAPAVEVVILFDDRVPAHVDVAEQLEKAFAQRPYRRGQSPRQPYELRRLGVDAARSDQHLAELRERPRLYAVAVGFEAARFAITELGVPTVFCQIFNYHELIERDLLLWGVASIPPLELQLRAWKELDPSLTRVGMIVGQEHHDLVHGAVEAGRATAVSVTYERSSSDRQTLYLFRRLAREIDGLWLFPDNRILSPAVIAELLSYAQAHGVQVTAFNASSLPAGVLMNASASPADIAGTVSRVLERVVAGDAHDLPRLTPLSEVSVDVDRDTAVRLQLDAGRLPVPDE